jgi:dienelactone hydrolase
LSSGLQKGNRVRSPRRNAAIFAGAFLVGVALLVGCTTLRFRPERSRAQAQLPEELLQRYAYPDATLEHADPDQRAATGSSGAQWETPFTFTVRPVSETRAYVLHEVEIATGRDPVRFDYYMVKSSRRGPVVLVFPIFGGKYVFAKMFSHYFARGGLHCALMYRKEALTDAKTFTEFEPALAEIVVDSKIAVDWLCARNEIDAERIGAFGISMGGIKSAVVKCLEPRVGPAVVALAGGTLAEILASSREPEIVERREEIMKTEGIDLVEFRERTEAAIVTDPLKLAPYADASEVKMFVTLFDRTVPTRCQFRLWRAFGRPELSVLPLGHYTAVLSIPYARWQSLRFFERRFGMKTPRRPPLPAQFGTAG